MPKAPCSALSSIWSSALHPPPHTHLHVTLRLCGPVLLASLCPFIHLWVMGSSLLGSHRVGGAESGALLAFSRAQACGPQLLLSYCASSSHIPILGAVGVCVRVCVRVGSELCTFREKLCWRCAGGGRVTATHGCRTGRAETQIQMSIFCCCCCYCCFSRDRVSL